jgi:hypothetical protein
LRQKAAYISSMQAVVDSHGVHLTDAEINRLNAELPDKFWVTEVTLADLYTANKTKLGDVITIVNPTLKQYTTSEHIIFAWLPGIVRSGVRLSGPQDVWSLTGHVPLLRQFPAPHLEW